MSQDTAKKYIEISGEYNVPADKLPFVSIVLAAYNEEKDLGRCIESLKKQDYPKYKFEIIVVDNNSTDRTAEIIKNSRVKYILETKQGRAEARNTGIKTADGDVIVIIDADCVAESNWLKMLVSGFINPDVGIVAGEIKCLEKEGLSVLESFLLKKDYLAQKQHVEHPFFPYAATANAAYRKELFDKIGYFTLGMTGEDDADFSWRMQIETPFKVAYAPDSVVYHSYEANIHEIYKQKKRHAIGYVNLYRIYKEYRKNEKKRFKKIYWEYHSIARRWLKLLLYRLKGRIAGRRHDSKSGSSSAPPVDEFQLIFETSWKIGLIKGSLKYKVWCI
jgi:cellulose synthase/poly-beta-1,6-N-acetylglucosamine synthase-like glycosyltransferase